jgi:hypothetical protein
MPRTQRAPFTVPALVLLLAVLSAGPAAAWGPNGHRAVGQVADNHLTPEARAALEELMGHESLARGGTWADDIRSDPAWDRASTWHYISIDDHETLETTERNPRGDVLEAMERFEAVLRNPEASREDRVIAVRFLTHFVGDVHQPLHVGRRDDRGGNEIVVLWHGEATNLHSVWDHHMIERHGLSFTELVRFIDHPTPEKVAEWQSTGYRDWVAESFALRNQVYDIGDRRLGYEYSYANFPTVERRILQAGVRLAGLLNSVFSSSPEP